MALRDVLIALLVVATWGGSFIAIKVGLREVPPFSLNFWRFALAAFPAVLFLGRPAVPWRWIVLYGLFNGVLQFGLLYTGIAVGMPAGLASLVIQSQALFTILLVIILYREPFKRPQQVGGGLMLIGLSLLAWQKATHGVSTHIGSGSVLLGFLLTIAAALSWSIANITARKAAANEPLAFIAWASLMAVPINLVIALMLEGGSAIAAPVMLFGTDKLLVAWVTLGCVLYLAWPSTIIGFGLYNALLAKYSIARVAPMTLLVPVSGMGLAAWLLDERMTLWQAAACVAIFFGLVINVFGGAFIERFSKSSVRPS
jgi:O-acetylserine/cysteine efflux transporter